MEITNLHQRLKVHCTFIERLLTAVPLQMHLIDEKLTKLDELIRLLPAEDPLDDLEIQWKAKARQFRVQLAETLPGLPDICQGIGSMAMPSTAKDELNHPTSMLHIDHYRESVSVVNEQSAVETFDPFAFKSGASVAAIREHIDKSFDEQTPIRPADNYSLRIFTTVVARALSLLEMPIMASAHDQLQKEIFQKAITKLPPEDQAILERVPTRPGGHACGTLSSLLGFLKDRLISIESKFKGKPSKFAIKFEKRYRKQMSHLPNNQVDALVAAKPRCSYCRDITHTYENCWYAPDWLCLKCYTFGHEASRCQKEPLLKFN